MQLKSKPLNLADLISCHSPCIPPTAATLTFSLFLEYTEIFPVSRYLLLLSLGMVPLPLPVLPHPGYFSGQSDLTLNLNV